MCTSVYYTYHPEVSTANSHTHTSIHTASLQGELGFSLKLHADNQPLMLFT